MVLGGERATRPRLSIDVEFPIDASIPAATDSIHDAIDYALVAAAVKTVCEEREYQLIETLADAVEAAVARQLALLPRKEIAGASWRDYGAIIEVGKLDDAVPLVDRLAPEHPFPASTDDGVATFRHIRDNAAAFGVDTARIAVGGDSAGGMIAAVICQTCRDSGEATPAFQMLIYPATDSSRDSASRKSFAEGYFLTRDLMDWFWKAYTPAGTDLADLRLSPLLARDFKGLPPAFVLTAGFDPLRDEGRAYADRLIEAGIKTTYVNYPGTIHGFFSLTRFLSQGLKANDEAAAVMAADRALNAAVADKAPDRFRALVAETADMIQIGNSLAESTGKPPRSSRVASALRVHAADAAHPRLDRADGEAGSDRGIDRVATFAQDRGTDFGGGAVLCDDDALASHRLLGDFQLPCQRLAHRYSPQSRRDQSRATVAGPHLATNPVKLQGGREMTRKASETPA